MQNYPTNVPVEVLLSPLKNDIFTCYRANYSQIRTHHRRYVNIFSRFNFKLNERPINENRLFNQVHANQRNPYKINCALGVILVNEEDNIVRYHYACHNNNQLLETPKTIISRQDFADFLDCLSAIDYVEQSSHARDDT